jgi:hypothetical protein
MNKETAFGHLSSGGKDSPESHGQVMCAPEQIGSGANPASCAVAFEVAFCGGGN